MRIFLTGSGGGIGSIISESLKANGIEVIEPKSKDLDLTKHINIENNLEYDGFIHCAGINLLANYKDVNKEDFNKLFQINTISFLELCSKLRIKNNANILAIGSLYSILTKENRIQYTMAKHALYGAVKTLALEMSKDNIKVNMISPGFVDTPMTRKNNNQDRIDYLNTNIPLGLTNPIDIANLCVYFVTKNNSITGQNILVDGGYSLRGI